MTGHCTWTDQGARSGEVRIYNRVFSIVFAVRLLSGNLKQEAENAAEVSVDEDSHQDMHV